MSFALILGRRRNAMIDVVLTTSFTYTTSKTQIKGHSLYTIKLVFIMKGLVQTGSPLKYFCMYAGYAHVFCAKGV